MAGSNCALGHGYRISQTPFPLQALPIDERHPSYPEDSYSYSKLAGELLLASYTRAYGIRTYVTRPAGIYSPTRRRQLAHAAAPATRWDPWLWAWVGSEDVANAHRLLMEEAETLPPHDIYYVTADDTTALEPSAELIARWQPTLLPCAEGLPGYHAFFSPTTPLAHKSFHFNRIWHFYVKCFNCFYCHNSLNFKALVKPCISMTCV
jgi:nucleoside-diphosphate-sugar epimerase